MSKRYSVESNYFFFVNKNSPEMNKNRKIRKFKQSFESIDKNECLE